VLKGKAVIGQSGGPTCVINSSLAGVIEEALKTEDITGILGMNYGIEGFMKEQFFNLGAQKDDVIKGLRQTPSSALGSSRHKLIDDDFPVIINILKKYNIRYFFLIGGNDTMDTVHRIEDYCKKENFEIRGLGIPKTVDNDLFGTDFTPGFPSAARSNILNVLQAGILARDMKKVDQFVIYQTIGRDAGWLAAATAMARKREGDAPHLIYCPERPLKPDQMIEDARECINKYGWVSIVVSEGLLYEDGTPVSAAETKDKFNNTEFGAMGGASVAMNVHKILTGALDGARGEFQVTESLIMSAYDRAERLDLDLAYSCGREAVRLAVGGETGVMITIERSSKNTFSLGHVPLSDVAVKARVLPGTFLNERGNDVTQQFIDYMNPLVTDLPEFVKLEQLFYKDE